MIVAESKMVIFKAWCYYIVAQLTPVAGLLATAADDHTRVWPDKIQLTSAALNGFIAGVIAVRAFFDGSNATFEANQITGTTTTDTATVTTSSSTITPAGQPVDAGLSAGSTISPATQVIGVPVQPQPTDPTKGPANV